MNNYEAMKNLTIDEMGYVLYNLIYPFIEEAPESEKQKVKASITEFLHAPTKKQ